jgi:hypothetical protein
LFCADQKCDVPFAAGEEIIDADDIGTTNMEPIAQMRTEGRQAPAPTILCSGGKTAMLS